METIEMKSVVLGFSLVLLLQASLFSTEPEHIIFDTDISGDVDDVLALAMLHTLADRGKCELLAVTISKQNPLAAPFVDAVNTFYGRPDIPIGISKTAPFRESKYLQLAKQRDGGSLRYPRDVGISQSPENAIDLLETVLKKARDKSVTIVQVGLAVNLSGLLQTESGPELIRKKVKRLSVMAGAFTTIHDNNHYLEANVRNHVPSMRVLAEKWPDQVPVFWSGFAIGISVPYPRESIAHDFDYVNHHIVKEAYLLHSGPHHDRPSWDLTSALFAVLPDRDYFQLSSPGRVIVEADGFTRFAPGRTKRDRYLKIDPIQGARVTEALVQFVSENPLNNTIK